GVGPTAVETGASAAMHKTIAEIDRIKFNLLGISILSHVEQGFSPDPKTTPIPRRSKPRLRSTGPQSSRRLLFPTAALRSRRLLPSFSISCAEAARRNEKNLERTQASPIRIHNAGSRFPL